MSVYNGEIHLQEAIDSILHQTFEDFEFLVIDDGSTDNTATIVASYSDPRIRFVLNWDNVGLAASLNRGIQVARGEYIARMDADDVSLPERLERQIDFMDAHPEVGVCGSWIENFGDVRSTIWKVPAEHERIVAELLFGDCIAHPSVLLRKSCLEGADSKYNPAMREAQDYDLWVRLSREGMRFANLREVLVRRRLHHRQVMKMHRSALRAASTRIRHLQLQHLGLAPSNEEMEMHEELSELRSHNDRITVEALRKWLDTVLEANRSTRFYDQMVLVEVLTSRFRRKAALLAIGYGKSCCPGRLRDVLRTMVRVDKGWFLWLCYRLLIEPGRRASRMGRWSRASAD